MTFSYGEARFDTITFTTGGSDKSLTMSGILDAISGNLTVTGAVSGVTANFQSGVFTTRISGTTITGNTGQFTNVTGGAAGFTTVTGATVTGTTARFTTVTGGTAGFTTITGSTITGTTANIVTVSGNTITGNTGQFTTLTGGTAGFTTVTGTTITGTTANFVTLSGTTVTGNTGQFTTLTGGTAGFTTVTGTTITGTSVNTHALVLTSGIVFPATPIASANASTLDDYEEGTFTPVIQGTTAAGAGTYSVQIGRYTKIGDTVLIQAVITWSAHTGTGNMRVASLPFVSDTTASFTPPVNIVVNNMTTITGGFVQALLNPGATTVELYSTVTTGTVKTLAALPMDTAATIYINTVYEASGF